MRLFKLKAVVWLHALRLWRYKISFINTALSITLWILLFLLGAFMFMPAGMMPEAVPVAFWGIAMWNIMSNVISLISGWTWYYLSQGFVEEHMLTDTSPFLVLLGRPITGLMMSLLAIAFTYVVTSALAGSPVIAIVEPFTLVLGMLFLITMSISVGLILAALAFKTGIPYIFLDILNFVLLIVGGLMTPVSKLPNYLRLVATFIPFSYPAELVRLATMGLKPWLPLNLMAGISLVLTASLLALAFTTMKWIESYVRKYGLRAIGKM